MLEIPESQDLVQSQKQQDPIFVYLRMKKFNIVSRVNFRGYLLIERCVLKSKKGGKRRKFSYKNCQQLKVLSLSLSSICSLLRIFSTFHEWRLKLDGIWTNFQITCAHFLLQKIFDMWFENSIWFHNKIEMFW